ncbi:von Willebrand factor type A domain protein, partial [Fusobacterium sp. CM21]
NLLKDNGGNNVRVGLVSYAGNNGAKYSNPVLEAVNLQKDKNNLKNIINNYQPYEGYMAGTFTQAGLRKANELFDNNTNEKIIVLISDGEPTYAYSAKQLLDFNKIHRANNDTPKPGYEIWSRSERNGKVWDDWKKGFDNSTYKSWGKKYQWTPYYVKLVPDPKVVGNGKYMDTII